MNDRRKTDTASHAHKRSDDHNDFSRLHQRLDDNDKILSELLSARVESVRLHTETTEAIRTLSALMERMAGVPEIAEDVRGMMRLLGRLNGFVGVLWKPLLFIAIVGGSMWILVTGGKPPP